MLVIQEVQAHLRQEDSYEDDWQLHKEQKASEVPSGRLQQQRSYLEGKFLKSTQAMCHVILCEDENIERKQFSKLH